MRNLKVIMSYTVILSSKGFFRSFVLLIGLTYGFKETWGQTVIHLPSEINSEFEEREPIPTPNGRMLYFWRRETPQNTGGVRDPGDIWYSRKVGGIWRPARRVGSPLNSRGHEFIWQVSPRQDTLWLVQNAPGVNDVGVGYSTQNEDGYWTRPNPIHIQNFTYKGDFKDFSFNRSRVMILPNEGTKTYGGTDLYVCIPKNDTSWFEPFNLGPVINSAADEDAGYLLSDNRTLFFNSNLNGKHEVYVSYRKGTGWANWTPPVPLGPPINTPANDFDFILSADERTAFWCSDREDGLGSNDIFSMNLRACEITLYPQGDQTICQGEELTLTAGYVLDKSLRYQWLKNGSPVKGGFERSLTVTTPGDYQLVRQTTYCVDTSAITQVSFVPPPMPEIETTGAALCVDDSIMLRAEVGDATQIQWQYNGLDLPGANRIYYYAQRPGAYTVKAEKGACAAVSPILSLETFAKPPIYLAKDTLLGVRRVPNRWLWTNKIPEKNGKHQIREIATGPKGDMYVLHAIPKGTEVNLLVSHFSAEGLLRNTFPVGTTSLTSRTFLVYHPFGSLLIGDDKHFLSSYSLTGTLLWTKARSFPQLLGLTTDPLGNIIVAATYEDTLYLGPKMLTPFGRGSAFLAKYDANGEVIWAEGFPIDGLRGDMGNVLGTDCLGNIYFTGKFKVIANFRKKIVRGTVGSDTYFATKFSPDGSLIWAHDLVVPTSRPSSADLHVDCEGNSYLITNQTIWLIDGKGNRRLREPLTLPRSAQPLYHRITAGNEHVLIATITAGTDLIVNELDYLNQQKQVLDLGGMFVGVGYLPAVAHDLAGNMYVAAVGKSNDLPGAQFDLTSKSRGFLLKRGKPDGVFQKEPVLLCRGEILSIMTDKKPGLGYQWYYNGAELTGETNFYLTVRKPGTYQVRTASANCDKLSGPFQVAGCKDDPMATPTITAVPASNKPLPAPAPPTRDATPARIDYSSTGKPKRIWGRKVKVQEEVRVSNRSVTLLVWDNRSEDNDTVSVNVNGDWITRYYCLKNQPKSFEVQLQPGDNYIILYAHNLGGVPPNTAALVVDDGKEKHQVVLASKMDRCGTLRVVSD